MGSEHDDDDLKTIQFSISRVLLETGPSVPNVNLTNGDKETALHCAAQYGHLECVKQLLDAGAEPNIKNIREETALDHAAQYGRQVTHWSHFIYSCL